MIPTIASKRVRTALRIASTCGALFAFAPLPGEKIAFHPEPGSTLRKTFTFGGDFELDSLSLVADGQDMADMLGLELSMKFESKIGVSDEVDGVEAGRPKKLTRTFDALEQTMHISVSAAMGEPQDEDITSSSQLEGQTVVFTWNEEKADFDVAFKDGEGDLELLEGLTEDMDLRAFLPDNEVAEEDSWNVDLADLHAVGMPGGDLGIRPDDPEVDESDFDFFKEMGEDFQDKLEDLFEGECSCTFRGIREEEGLRLGEIAIQIEIESSMDLTELLMEMIGKVAEFGAEMPEFSVDTADLNLDFDGEGTLLWNLAAGRAHSFSLSGNAQIAFDIAASVEAEGESHSFEASLEMSGNYEQGLETGE